MDFFSSIAATPLAQTQGSDVDRAALETAGQARQVANDLKAENAAGVGQTDGEEHQSSDRDADGHRLWENTPGKPAKHASAAADQSPPAVPPASKDPTGQSGNQLDLTG